MSLPTNVRVSEHPCLNAKLSMLRSSSTNARETKALVHEISVVLACEALARNLSTKDAGTDRSPLGHEYSTVTTHPSVALVPILRSGLGMLEAFQLLLPQPVPIHHLGLYREPTTLQPVEYYNNLPYHKPGAHQEDPCPSIAILLDPVIATGGTSSAAIQTLFDWGVQKVILVSIIANREGLQRAATQTSEDGRAVDIDICVGAVDEGLNDRGMIKPGLGDIGDRLFQTLGK